MKKLIDWLRREKGQVAAILFCLFVLFYAYSCESKVMSMETPGKMIGRGELELELDTYVKLAEIRFDQLNRQDKIKQVLFEQAILASQTGTVNPLGVFAVCLSALGIGAVADNVSKRATIRKNNRTSIDNVSKDKT